MIAAFALGITVLMSSALVISAISMDIVRLALESNQYVLIHPLLGRVFGAHFLWDFLIFVILVAHALSLLGLALFFLLRPRK